MTRWRVLPAVAGCATSGETVALCQDAGPLYWQRVIGLSLSRPSVTASWSMRGLMADDPCATLSHMKVGVRELRNQTSQVIDAVRAGERVTLTIRGEPIADIVPHKQRTRWLSGPNLKRELQSRAADPDLTRELNELAGHTLDEL